MSSFVCQSCGSIDNTALTRFWFREEATEGKALCSACDIGGPSGGKWHGAFPRRKYDPDGDYEPSWVDGEWQERT